MLAVTVGVLLGNRFVGYRLTNTGDWNVAERGTGLRWVALDSPSCEVRGDEVAIFWVVRIVNAGNTECSVASITGTCDCNSIKPNKFRLESAASQIVTVGMNVPKERLQSMMREKRLPTETVFRFYVVLETATGQVTLPSGDVRLRGNQESELKSLGL